jgi:hypothetical protein
VEQEILLQLVHHKEIMVEVFLEQVELLQEEVEQEQLE